MDIGKNKNSDDLESKDSSSSVDDSVIETDSLEGPSNDVQSAPGEQSAAAKVPKRPGGFKKLTRKFNIYLLLFILVLIISGGILAVTALSGKTEQEQKIDSQAVPSATLKQLATSDATVGDPKQVLNVQSNAVFAGKVLIRDSLDVAGQIRVSGSLSLPGITVSGDSTFEQVSINKTLNIGGDASVLGQLNVKKNLTVSGTGTFAGAITAPQIATSQLQILGDLTTTRHIVTGGATPGRSSGGALGAGGTASVSGSDTSGSININTGSNPAAGCFLTVEFTSRFNNTPHVVITPVGSDAALLNYYVTRTTTGFSVCTASVPGVKNYVFDYIVLG